tara:strand:+ start:795 stop:902 length:108 start_codon:yes stop_codon:yes gene_type:complete
MPEIKKDKAILPMMEEVVKEKGLSKGQLEIEENKD